MSHESENNSSRGRKKLQMDLVDKRVLLSDRHFVDLLGIFFPRWRMEINRKIQLRRFPVSRKSDRRHLG